LNTAFDGAKPFKISCGSYHNICLSYKPPKQEETTGANSESDENAMVNNKGVLGSKNHNIEETKQSYVHSDETCPNVEQVKKLKADLKKYR